MLAVALLSVVVTQAPVSHEAELEKARALIIDLYEEQALEVLAPLLSDAALAKPERSQALVYAGIAHFNLSQDVQGREAFRQLHELGEHPVMPEWVSPRVRAEFEAERKAAAARRVKAAEEAKRVAAVVKPELKTRPSWVAGTLIGGLVVSAAFSTLGFVRFGELYGRAGAEPVALRSEALDAQSRGWLVMGEVAAGAAVLITAGLLWWWLGGP